MNTRKYDNPNNDSDKNIATLKVCEIDPKLELHGIKSILCFEIALDSTCYYHIFH